MNNTIKMSVLLLEKITIGLAGTVLALISYIFIYVEKRIKSDIKTEIKLETVDQFHKQELQLQDIKTRLDTIDKHIIHQTKNEKTTHQLLKELLNIIPEDKVDEIVKKISR
ncbi:MAG: hypothetical protein ACO25K_05185 [Candidatus Fonsibacter ubiquis]